MRLKRTAFPLAAATLALAAPAMGQEDGQPADGGAAMQSLEKAVAPQSWYPEGYYDVRIAAEAQIAETPRAEKVMIGKCADGSGSCYDLVDPLAPRIARGETDPILLRYGNVALETSRIRQELTRLGYPAAAYSEPLAAYEKQLVDAATNRTAGTDATEDAAVAALAGAIETNRQRLAPKLPRVTAPGAATPGEQGATILVVRTSGPVAARYPAGSRLKADDRLTLVAGDRIVLLERGGTRTLTGPGTFAAGGLARGGDATGYLATRLLAHPVTRTRAGAVRGGQRGSVLVATSPPGGEVLLTTAFAFKLCTRKKVDIWDRFACKWNEVETGVERPLSGRYVYQVKWPDGTVRKGTRDIVPEYDSDDAVTVTFKKSGS